MIWLYLHLLFSPSSFGVTNYAYTRVNDNNELLELREKESFTNKKHNEYANTGIYYFKSYELFKMYAQDLIENTLKPKEEAYISLISNKIVKEKGKVLITKVKKFICLGTPFDYRMYIFWSDYFNNDNKVSNENEITDINLIPMAGKGSRFKKEGYNSIKAMTQLKMNLCLLNTKSFPKSKEWIFVFRELQAKIFNILNTLKENFKRNLF